MEHVRNRPASDSSAFIQAIAGLVVAVLVTLGVGGTVYKFVAPGGWIAQVFSRSVAGGMAAILALLIIGLCTWPTRSWIPIGARNRHSEILVYAFSVAGAVYAVRFLAKGGL